MVVHFSVVIYSIYTQDARLGIGVVEPRSVLDILGDNINLFGYGDADLNLEVADTAAGNPEVRFKVAGEQKAFLRYLKTPKLLLLRNQGAESFSSLALGNGRVGVGTTNPLAPLHLHTQRKDQGLRITTAGFATKLFMHLARRSNGTEYGFIDLGGGTKIRGNGEPTIFTGSVTCRELTLNGADIVELVFAKEKIQPGEVVVIDPTHPNGVCRSTYAYDKRVLGVVSGAGGVKHALELSQDGVLDGNTRVATNGRVWVQVTGAVYVGDLLTSSRMPGKAMTARNPRKAFGSIIGKALTPVNSEGMVLMLVTVN